MIPLMEGKLILHQKKQLPDGSIIEMKIWKVPITPFIPHGLKYSLVYIENNKRVIGYDNAERKEDHRHFKGKEEKYTFKSVKKLLNDFFLDINRYKEERS